MGTHGSGAGTLPSGRRYERIMPRVPYTPRGPRLYYERRGSGEPLLCITGFAISSAVFEPVLPRLGERFDVITYDQRWSGRGAAAPDLDARARGGRGPAA